MFFHGSSYTETHFGTFIIKRRTYSSVFRLLRAFNTAGTWTFSTTVNMNPHWSRLHETAPWWIF